MAAPALVLFDLDGVLVHYDRPTRYRVLAQRSGRSEADVEAALFGSGLETESDLGRWHGPDFAEELGRRLGAAIGLADCIAARAASTTVDQRVLALAQRVAARAQVGILTNNGFYLRDALPAVCPALFPLFEGRVRCSAQFSRCKPDPGVFEQCLRTLGALPKDTLFFDDNADNAEGARRAGLIGRHFTGPALLAACLREHGLIEHEDDDDAL